MAEALAKLTEAGKTLETIKIMPKMIEAVTPAFEKMGNITVIQSGGGENRGGVTRTVTDSIKDILATAPAILKTYGIDIKELIPSKSEEVEEVEEAIK